MGVLIDSSRFKKAGVPGCGLRSSEGYDAETGVCTVLSLRFVSCPDAADVAATAAAGGASVVVVDMLIFDPLRDCPERRQE